VSDLIETARGQDYICRSVAVRLLEFGAEQRR
jgi:hypothetical protein